MGKSVLTVSAADIFVAADRLLEEHGQDAVTVASMQASESLARGDMDAYRTWKRVGMVVDELSALAPAAGALTH